MAHLIDVAAGRQPADLIFTNGQIVDVYQGKVIQADVAVADGTIVSIGDHYQAKQVIDIADQFSSPG